MCILKCYSLVYILSCLTCNHCIIAWYILHMVHCNLNIYIFCSFLQSTHIRGYAITHSWICFYSHHIRVCALPNTRVCNITGTCVCLSTHIRECEWYTTCHIFCLMYDFTHTRICAFLQVAIKLTRTMQSICALARLHNDILCVVICTRVRGMTYLAYTRITRASNTKFTHACICEKVHYAETAWEKFAWICEL